VQLFKPYDTAAKQAARGKNSASDRGDGAPTGKKSSDGSSKSARTTASTSTVTATSASTATTEKGTATSTKAHTTSGSARTADSKASATTARTAKGDTTKGHPAEANAATTKGDTTKTTTTSGNANSRADAPKAPTKKTIPTPTRREAEQARRDRIQPVLTRKESKVREREARFKARDEAMAKANARPHNELIRDWVDRRWNLAEFALPLILVLFVAMIIGTYIWPVLMFIAPYVIWAVFVVLVIDTLVMWFGLRKQLKTHFPNEPLKGKLSYAVSRTMLMRRSRVPAPRVKRGQKFTWPHREDQS
jgi:hypothetical protein